MKTVKEAAPVVCDVCGKVFYAKYAFMCPKCRKEANSERAKNMGLHKLGNEAYSQQRAEYHALLDGKGEGE